MTPTQLWQTTLRNGASLHKALDCRPCGTMITCLRTPLWVSGVLISQTGLPTARTLPHIAITPFTKSITMGGQSAKPGTSITTMRMVTVCSRMTRTGSLPITMSSRVGRSTGAVPVSRVNTIITLRLKRLTTATGCTWA